MEYSMEVMMEDGSVTTATVMSEEFVAANTVVESTDGQSGLFLKIFELQFSYF